MVLNPRAPGPRIPLQSVVFGHAYCLFDAGSGLRHPVPLTYVELHLADPTQIAMLGGSLLDTTTTDARGGFELTVPHNLESKRWRLRLQNAYTRETKDLRLVQGVTHRYFHAGLTEFEFDVGSVVLPWDPMLPALAEVNGRHIKSLSGLSWALSAELTATNCTVSLLSEVASPKVLRDRALAEMFKILAAQAQTPTGLVGRIVAKVRPTIKLSSPGKDLSNDFKVLATVLRQVSLAGNNAIYSGNLANEVGSKITDALMASKSAIFEEDPLPGLAAVFFLLFVAAHVAQGHTVDVQLSQIEDRSDPRRHRHYRTIRIIIS